MKKEVLLDVDGVIANFTQLYVDRANHHWPGNDYRVEEITQWDCREALALTQEQQNIIMDDSFAAHLSPYPGAVRAIKALHQIADVFFVTSHFRSKPTWVYDRDQWLEQHFGGKLGRRVIHTEYKYKIPGDVFVDDKPEHVDEWQERHPGSQGLLWEQPYNQKHSLKFGRSKRVSNWLEVYEAVQGKEGK